MPFQGEQFAFWSNLGVRAISSSPPAFEESLEGSKSYGSPQMARPVMVMCEKDYTCRTNCLKVEGNGIMSREMRSEKCGIGRSETKGMKLLLTGCGKVDLHLMSFYEELELKST